MPSATAAIHALNRDPATPRAEAGYSVDFPYHSELAIERYYDRYCAKLRSVADGIGRVLRQFGGMNIPLSSTKNATERFAIGRSALEKFSHMKKSSFMTLLALASVSLTAAGDTTPANEAAQAASSKIRHLIAKLPQGSSHHLDVAYVPGTKPGTKPDSVQTLDLYVPEGEGPFPLVFWIHGGGWHSGGKLDSGIHLALKFLPRGFALASINYRLTGDAPFPAQIQDCNAALAYLRQRADTYRIDPDRVGTLGHSAGAHLAALMACTGNENRFSADAQASLRVQAAVCWAIPADLDRDRGQWPKTSMMHNAADRPLWRFFPSNGYDGELARMASPASYVHADVPPIHIVHGQQDDLVPPGQVLAFAEALKKAGAPITLRVIPDLGHNVMNAKSVDEAIGFFTRVLKPDKS